MDERTIIYLDDAIDVAKRLLGDSEISRTMQTALRILPSAQPERKTGQWIDGKCNRCGTHAPYWAMASTYYCSEYCPHCGTKMESE